VRPVVNLEVPHRLLESLGVATQAPAAQEACEKGRLATRLALTAPEALEQCVEGCYWRWLVHTLLQDLESLKRSMDETQEDLEQRIDERKKIKEIIDRRDRILEELHGMKRSLKTLRIEVPQLRREHKSLQAEADWLEARQQKLQADQDNLEKSLKKCEDRQRNFRMKVDSEESRDRECKQRVEDLNQRIRSLEEEATRHDMLRDQLKDERDQLRDEVNQLEESRGGKKGRGQSGVKRRARSKGKK